MYKGDLALNNGQWFTLHKTKPIQNTSLQEASWVMIKDAISRIFVIIVKLGLVSLFNGISTFVGYYC